MIEKDGSLQICRIRKRNKLEMRKKMINCLFDICSFYITYSISFVEQIFIAEYSITHEIKEKVVSQFPFLIHYNKS